MRILLIEDHPVFRFGLRQLIAQRWPEAELLEAGTLAEGLTLARSQPPAVAVLDLNLPDAAGVESVAACRRAFPALPLLVLSLNDEAAYASRVLQLGASGYLAKDRALDELVHALQRVLAGGRYISTALAERMADRLAGASSSALQHESLSDQELRILLLLAQGQRVGQIAERMHLSPKTVSTYRSRLLDKLGLSSNLELADYCRRHALITTSL